MNFCAPFFSTQSFPVPGRSVVIPPLFLNPPFIGVPFGSKSKARSRRGFLSVLPVGKDDGLGVGFGLIGINLALPIASSSRSLTSSFQAHPRVFSSEISLTKACFAVDIGEVSASRYESCSMNVFGDLRPSTVAD